MTAELYQTDFIYKDKEDDYAYDLAILPKIAQKVVVVITAKSQKAGLSIASFYPALAKKIYFKHLQKLETTHIIWVEMVVQRTNDAVFFKIDLQWDKQSAGFYCSTGSLNVNKLSFLKI